jgi:SagB-type dehydrogenase family enzyme
MNYRRYKTSALKFFTIFLILTFLVTLSASCDANEEDSPAAYEKNEESQSNSGEDNSDTTEVIEAEAMDDAEGEEIILPQPVLESDVSLEEALNKRRSVRNFSSEELSLDQISQILWAAQGITDQSTGHRTSPSAGALYPLEIFLLKSDGVYHYEPDGHKIFRLTPDDLRQGLLPGALNQRSVAEAPLDIIITAVYERVTSRYGERGIQFVHLEAGHSCQNILLQATALGLGAVSVGAFDDSYIQDLLDLPEDHIPIYIVPIGYSKE